VLILAAVLTLENTTTSALWRLDSFTATPCVSRRKSADITGPNRYYGHYEQLHAENAEVINDSETLSGRMA